MLVERAHDPRPSGADDEHRDPCPGGALSENTERAMRSDIAIYRAWCRDQGVTAVPAGPETIAKFIDAMAFVRAPATVRRYTSSIAAAHRACGLEKATKNELVRRALGRMDRRKGRRQDQAKGLTEGLRQRLLDSGGNALIDARNRALLSTGYDSLLRRSELVSLQVSDIVQEIDGSGTVLVRRSKSDPEGRGAMAYLAPDTMKLVDQWLRRSCISEGNVFRSLSRGVLGPSLEAGQVSRIFKRMAGAAGLPKTVVEHISGHSTRVGAAQDMVSGGVGMAAILHAGRWRTEAMVQRYADRLVARRSGAAQLARLQHRA